MTAGNPKMVVRFSADTLEQIDEAIKRRNARTREEPWDRSAFVRCAVRDKLHHMQRSRRRKGRRSASTTADTPSEV